MVPFVRCSPPNSVAMIPDRMSRDREWLISWPASPSDDSDNEVCAYLHQRACVRACVCVVF